ncbi:hypothetical protein GXB85_15945 [Cellulomonas sp. APG4]|uniref:hypothetical protein n=1 Tax=Cellulomonas sp. APG4 TaxID=1538656 RepID=UPI00137AB05E|nr:hypothetical protein [Cellulomonas sp. APG4]NCT92428.1 hypothetical protein [Cellulomonas sp. APG4]
MEDAELATEHYDVRAEEYRFWDSEGQIFRALIREESGFVSQQPTGDCARAEADLTIRESAEAVGLDSEPKVAFSELQRSIWSWQTGSE